MIFHALTRRSESDGGYPLGAEEYFPLSTFLAHALTRRSEQDGGYPLGAGEE
jgi:hypothetical protein